VSLEPRFQLAVNHYPWAAQQADDMITALDALGVPVVGDLDDLRPRTSAIDAVPPDELPESLITAAGIDATAGLVAELARRQERIRRLERHAHTSR
jgi:hypothetical protein